jgi:hypothetical protein
VIIAVGSDKGSPGATTLATVLGMLWPGERVVCELDARGADLPYRMRAAGGGPLAASPSVATLAVDSRPGAGVRSLLMYAQLTAAGVPVITGEVSAHRFANLAGHLPAIGDAFAAWPGTVIADLGCLQPANPALRLARLATVVVLVTRADTESLGHLRDRVEELSAQVGGPHLLRSPVAVAVRASRSEAGTAVSRVERLLGSIGSPVPVIGAVPDDPTTVAGLYSGSLPTRTQRSGLLVSVRELAERLQVMWPELTDEVPAAYTDRAAEQLTVTAGRIR